MLKKIRELIRAQLVQGVTPRGLALTCAMALVLSTFPLLGTTTFLCLMFGMALKLNQPVMQALNYAMTPVHLLLVPVFLKIGERVVGAEPVSLNPQLVMAEFFTDWKLFLEHYGMAGLHAILAWTLIAPAVGFVVFFVLNAVFTKLKKQQELRIKNPSLPEVQ